METLRSRRGGVGFENDGRRRAWFTWGALVALVLFVGGLGRIWLCTAVADHASRVQQLEQRIERLRVDLDIAANSLEQRRFYADIAPTAALVGFESAQLTHWVPLPQETPVAQGTFDQLAHDLRRGSQWILAEALAGEQPWERARADRR